MKPALIIGSTCVDVIINLEHLPRTEEDLHPTAHTMAVGGCAYNVAAAVRTLGAEHTFITPVGSGMFGDYVKKTLEQKNVPINVYIPEKENGCCYCFVEQGGERTFLAWHGVEYTFQEEWMDRFDSDEFGLVYICGLEIEEPTGENIIRYLQHHPNLTPVYGPGARGVRLTDGKNDEVFALSPILHVNREEAFYLAGVRDVEEAAKRIQEKTRNMVIITLGADGSFCRKANGESFFVPPVKVDNIVDTIGAGDSHVGAVIAMLTKGAEIEEALAVANRVSAAVICVQGGSLPEGWTLD